MCCIRWPTASKESGNRSDHLLVPREGDASREEAGNCITRFELTERSSPCKAPRLTPVICENSRYSNTG